MDMREKMARKVVAQGYFILSSHNVPAWEAVAEDQHRVAYLLVDKWTESLFSPTTGLALDMPPTLFDPHQPGQLNGAAVLHLGRHFSGMLRAAMVTVPKPAQPGS